MTPALPAFWTEGDDGLTLRLAAAVEAAYVPTPRLQYITTGPDKLLIKVRDWRKIGPRIQVRYHVQFARDGRQIGVSTGRCWDDEMNKCAAQIARDAKRVEDR